MRCRRDADAAHAGVSVRGGVGGRQVKETGWWGGRAVKGGDSTASASGPSEKVGHLLEGPQGLVFPAEIAEEEAMLRPLKMEQHACGYARAGKGHWQREA